MRQTKEPENNHDDGRWDRNQKGEPAGLFRSEQIETPMIKIDMAANFSGCGTPRYEKRKAR